ncbi:TetR/AcrR family transcriptional regulator [Nocardia sp. CA-107356]|uniref:TetR/AcrR family transcriptional regulator n=1 Tax=Nocardia sp. CA-107356 TaxID=3239972 RepID=UPI003D8DD0A6
MSTAAGLGTKGMPSDDRRQRILLAALREFADRGFGAVSVASVAARAGISKALVFQHFSSKDQLYAACAIEVGEPLLTRLEAEMTSGANPSSMPIHALRGIFETLGPDRTAWRILHDPTAPDTGAAGPIVHRYRTQIDRFATDGVTRFLANLGDTDRGDIDALIGIWTSAVDSIMTYARDHPAESADDLTERFTRLIDAVFTVGPIR